MAQTLKEQRFGSPYQARKTNKTNKRNVHMRSMLSQREFGMGGGTK
jgi:hypothetical protein